MTFLEAYTIVTKEFETTPYNRNAMVEAFMGGYRMSTNKSYEWLKARNVLTDASLEGYRKAMEE